MAMVDLRNLGFLTDRTFIVLTNPHLGELTRGYSVLPKPPQLVLSERVLWRSALQSNSYKLATRSALTLKPVLACPVLRELAIFAEVSTLSTLLH